MRDYFDEPVADVYDDDTAMFDAAVVGPAVDFLADLAGEGAALEFGIGTGRIALPLSEKGVPVDGIDLSGAMLTRLKEKAGAGAITAVEGDFSSTEMDGSYALVYLVFNTIMNLTTQEMQVACFENAARHLDPGGSFVIECMVPRLQRLPPGETLQAFDVSENHWGVDEIDVVSQQLTSHHVQRVDGELRSNALPCRYVWPSELDLMAQIAGLAPAGRYAGFEREPFTAASESHVSVWTLPA